jgi:hypothetical protein
MKGIVLGTPQTSHPKDKRKKTHRRLLRCSASLEDKQGQEGDHTLAIQMIPGVGHVACQSLLT